MAVPRRRGLVQTSGYPREHQAACWPAAEISALMSETQRLAVQVGRASTSSRQSALDDEQCSLYDAIAGGAAQGTKFPAGDDDGRMEGPLTLPLQEADGARHAGAHGTRCA